MSENKKCVYRHLPCPAWDAESMESWLSDMEGEGLRLCADGFFLGLASFERVPPRKVKYRLEPAQRPSGFVSPNAGEPDEEAVELSAKYGWEFVARSGDFFVYRSADPEAREPNTDPAVQALALKAVEKRLRSSALMVLFWALVYPALNLRGKFLLTALTLGSGLSLLLVCFIALMLALSFASALRLSGLRKRILAGEGMNHAKDWKKHALRSRVLRFAPRLFALLLAILFLVKWAASSKPGYMTPLDDFTGSAPFATIADLRPDGEYSRRDIGFSNEVRVWSDLLSPVNYDWNEIADIALPDGTYLDGGMYADYHEAASPLIAKLLTKEYMRSRFFWTKNEPIDLPPLGVDFAAAYYENDSHFPTLLLRNGNKVLRVAFYQTSSTYTMPLEDWAQILADSLK